MIRFTYNIKDTTKTMETLYALAIGDVYGIAFEFMDAELIRHEYPILPETSLGGGPFDFQAGDFSDDTEMSALILYSLHHLGVVNVQRLTDLWLFLNKAGKSPMVLKNS